MLNREKVRALIKSKGLSIKAVALTAGINPDNLSEYLRRDVGAITFDMVMRLCYALQINPLEYFVLEPPTTTKPQKKIDFLLDCDVYDQVVTIAKAHKLSIRKYCDAVLRREVEQWQNTHY